MPFQFKYGDPSLQDGVRRIAVAQIEHAIGEIDDKGLPLPETVHQVRTRCKKLRSLIRIVRPVFEDYAVENAAFREAARTLSFIRDLDSLIEAYDKVTSAHAGRINPSAVASIRDRLNQRQKRIAGTHDPEGRLSAFRETMCKARERAAQWRVEAREFEGIHDGFEKTYRLAGDAMGRALQQHTPEAFHEWRKQVKYHWYHARLLAPAWPESMKVRRETAEALSESLGEHHDLAVLHHTLAAEPDAFAGARDAEILLGLIAADQNALEKKSFSLGRRLFAEPTHDLSERCRTHWTDWRGEQRWPDRRALPQTT